MGDPIVAPVPDGSGSGAAKMRDYRNRDIDYARAYARWQRQTREKAVAALIHRHSTEFNTLLNLIRRSTRKPEKS